MTIETLYPGYDVLAKWDTPSFNEQTREVVARRLHVVPERRYLGEDEWALLEAVAARLLPQPDRAQPVPIVPWIDDMLAEDRGEGYRRDGMPPLRAAWRQGLAALADEANRRHGRSFADLGEDEQDAVLTGLQNGEAGEPAKLFFSELLLRTVVGIYYAHPDAWNEIGFGGPASPRGYVRMGPDKHDPWEAKKVPRG